MSHTLAAPLQAETFNWLASETPLNFINEHKERNPHFQEYVHKFQA